MVGCNRNTLRFIRSDLTKIINCIGGVVSVAIAFGLDNREVGVKVLVGSRILTSPYPPDQLWGPPNLSNG
jgi:hypothetical protein